MTLDRRPFTVTEHHGSRMSCLAFPSEGQPEDLEASVAAFHDWWSGTCRMAQIGKNGPRLWWTRRGNERRPIGARDVARWWSLSCSDRRIAELVALGLTNREIGGQMFLSRHAISSRVRSIFDKLDVRSREELVRLALTLVPESLCEFDTFGTLPTTEPEHLATITPLRSSARCTSKRRSGAPAH
jgi:DNA-binding CsgD family transcriptional regulator